MTKSKKYEGMALHLHDMQTIIAWSIFRVLCE